MTINNANINYQTSLAQVSQSVPKEPKENANNSQELQQSDTPNNAKEDSDIFAIARMKAFESVKRNFGYGINDEGFFTSDLNEAAGIPKDIKIDGYRGVLYNLMSIPLLGYYNNIDLVGSVKNYYQAFSKLSEQEQDNIVNKTKDIKYFLENGTEYSLYDTLLEKFADGNGGLNQSGKLEAFIQMNPDLMVGEKTINLAISSGIGEYAKYFNEDDNLIGMHTLDKGKAGQLLRTSINEMSAEEFGKQWGELRKEYQAKYNEQQERFRKENEEIEEYNRNLAEQKTKNKFKPIQVTSKSETYKDTDFLNALDFIKSQQKLEQILLLFGEGNKGSLDIKDLKKYFTSPNRLDTEA